MSYLLDSNAKTSFLTKIPRSVRLVLGIALCILILLLIIFAIRTSVRELYRKNRSFVLERIEISTESELLKREVETALNLVGIRQFDSYLPDLPLRQLRETLLENSRINDVRIRRFYPDSLRIEVIPRMPVAILHFSPNSGKGELLIDQDGMVLPRNVSASSTHLPTIIGIKNPAEFQEGKRSEDKAIQAFLTFLKESRLRPEGSEYEIINVKLDDKNDRMTLILKASGVFKPGAQMVMPLEDVPGELNRIQMVVELRRNANETISYINATYNNIPVRP